MIEYKWILFNDESINTHFICPHCNQGKMILDKKLCNEQQYESNKKYTDKYENGEMIHWDIHSLQSAVSGLLKCDNCNDFCAFLGEVQGGEDYEYSPEYQEEISVNSFHLNFKYINPPIKLIKIYKEYPENIKKVLNESFLLFWNHEASCLNKLRVVVEEVLDNLKVPRRIKIRNGTNRGKFQKLTTHKRIEELSKKLKYKSACEYLLALKWIGNKGSHSTIIVDEKTINQTYEILDKALDLIYVHSDKKLLNRVIEINKKKSLFKMNIKVNALNSGGIFDSQVEVFWVKHKEQCLNNGMLDKSAWVYLLSDMNKSINSQNMVVDDGFSL